MPNCSCEQLVFTCVVLRRVSVFGVVRGRRANAHHRVSRHAGRSQHAMRPEHAPRRHPTLHDGHPMSGASSQLLRTSRRGRRVWSDQDRRSHPAAGAAVPADVTVDGRQRRHRREAGGRAGGAVRVHVSPLTLVIFFWSRYSVTVLLFRVTHRVWTRETRYTILTLYLTILRLNSHLQSIYTQSYLFILCHSKFTILW